MSVLKNFESLECWKAARVLTKEVYKISSTGILAKDFDTKSQLRRAALSTMNNIAEGFGRYHKKEFLRFLDFSQSSAAEVKSMLYMIEDLKYLSKIELQALHAKVDKTRNLTIGLIKYIAKRNN